LDFIVGKRSLDNCSHIFCKECIVLWSKVTNTCPLCKARFTEIISPDSIISVQHKVQIMPEEDDLNRWMDLEEFNEEWNLLGEIFEIPESISSESNISVQDESSKNEQEEKKKEKNNKKKKDKKGI